MIISSIQKWNTQLARWSKNTNKREKRFERKLKQGNENQQKHRRNAIYLVRLRKNITKAEKEFGNLLCELNIHFEFQRGFLVPYHRIVDFYIPINKIAFEVDGGYHKNTQKQDDFKDKWLRKKRGIATYRILNEEVFNNRDALVYRLNSIFNLRRNRKKKANKIVLKV